MTKWIIAAALAAIPAAAAAQDSNWGYFESGGLLQAGLAGSDGSQLILKCDKAGEHRVYAVIVSPSQIAPAKGASEYESRDVSLLFDGSSPMEDQWRFNDKFAMAMDIQNLRSMSRFGQKLAGAKTLQATLKPFRLSPVILEFPVAGADEAMKRVYESCKDKLPY